MACLNMFRCFENIIYNFFIMKYILKNIYKVYMCVCICIIIIKDAFEGKYLSFANGVMDYVICTCRISSCWNYRSLMYLFCALCYELRKWCDEFFFKKYIIINACLMINIVPEYIYFDYSPSHQNLFFSIIIFIFGV